METLAPIVVMTIIAPFVMKSFIDIIVWVFEGFDKELNPGLLRAISLVLGLLVAFAFNLDMMVTIGAPVNIPYLGIVFTGILMARGSNVINDLLEQLKIK